MKAQKNKVNPTREVDEEEQRRIDEQKQRREDEARLKREEYKELSERQKQQRDAAEEGNIQII